MTVYLNFQSSLVFNFTNLIIQMNIPQKFQVYLKQISRSTDLKSIGELSLRHLEVLNKQQPRYMRTTDTETIKLAQKILQNNSFLNDNILGIPQTKEKELESQIVTISDISKYPRYEAIYKQWRNQRKQRLISIGGPSATDQSLLSLLIPQIRHSHSVHFYIRNYLQSNSNHSAKQILARHAPALYSDPNYSALKLLPLIAKRLLFSPTIDQIMRPNFSKVDMKMNSLKAILLYMRSQVNWFKEMVKERKGEQSEHDVNRLEGVLNREILRVMEIESEVKLTTRGNHRHMSIHLALDKHTEQEIEEERQVIGKVQGLVGEKINLKDIFPMLYSAWGFPGDSSIKYDIYDRQKQKVKELGGKWEQNKTLSRVFVRKGDNSNVQACGVLFEDGEFVPADKIHLSLGYRAKYLYEGHTSYFGSLESYNITSTGVSSTLILKRNPQLNKLLQLNNGSFELMGLGGHWTHIAQNQDYILARATAGGNTGSQGYMASYFLNMLMNSRRIFGDAMIGVVSAYGCSRSVNYKNSTQFAQLAHGLLVSYGKGGTGHIKRSAEAAMALTWLGLGNQVKEFFEKNNQRKENEQFKLDLSQTIRDVCSGCSRTGMYYSQIQRTLKSLRM